MLAIRKPQTTENTEKEQLGEYWSPPPNPKHNATMIEAGNFDPRKYPPDFVR